MHDTNMQAQATLLSTNNQVPPLKRSLKKGALDFLLLILHRILGRQRRAVVPRASVVSLSPTSALVADFFLPKSSNPGVKPAVISTAELDGCHESQTGHRVMHRRQGPRQPMTWLCWHVSASLCSRSAARPASNWASWLRRCRQPALTTMT